MLERKYWQQRTKTFVIAVIFALQANIIDDGIPNDHCEHRVVGYAPSADNEWEAKVVERICPVGFAGSVIILSVRLDRADSPFRPVGILSLETGGYDNEWPQIAWTASRALHVYVPNAAYLAIYNCRVADIVVDIQFTPVNLNEWGRRYGIPPQPEPPPPTCPTSPAI